ncbi:unnamed protein product [Ostreobium quekettii]|uniref:Tetrapyrrole methylase domain-containing protein n=1 Tax=Ostreobium quekettii TaxID=121088 RepID=A0A8S1JAT8_9CHLO|nr:unnamed protein product [Ostreobium quekettii]
MMMRPFAMNGGSRLSPRSTPGPSSAQRGYSIAPGGENDNEHEGEDRQLEPGLHVVATPIGNLGDVTLRALETLRRASCVLAEDTRHTAKLMSVHGLRAEMRSCHGRNEAGRAAEVAARVARGEVRQWPSSVLLAHQE